MLPLIRNISLLFLGCLLFHIAGTWSLPLVDRDEPRFAEASREMRERGDYIVPYFNDHYRFDKPPLIYWLQTTSYTVFGENDFAARFPSAVAAAGTAVLLLLWGKRIADERLGWWAAIIFTVCLQTFLHAKAAVADMWLILFVTLAHWALYELLRDLLGQAPAASGRKLLVWRFVFYIALGLAFLAKGPLGWMPLVTAAVVRFVLHQKLGRRLQMAWGIPLMLAIVAAWGIPAVIKTHGLYFQVGIGRHVVERALLPSEGHGSKSLAGYLLLLPFYFVTVFASFFPWSIKLPGLLKRVWARRDRLDLFFIAGTVPLFVLLTFVSTKLPHYTLPSFPILSLAMARHLTIDGRGVSFSRSASTSMAIACVLTALIAFPQLAKLFPSAQLIKLARPYLEPSTDIAAYDYAEPSLVWYFREYVSGYLQGLYPGNIAEYMKTRGPRLIIMPTKTAQQLYPTIPPEWKSFNVSGFELVKGKWSHLTMLIKPRTIYDAPRFYPGRPSVTPPTKRRP